MSKSRRRTKTYSNLQCKRPPLTAKTARQSEYIQAIKASEQVVCLGPAGTGKTYIAACMAADALMDGHVNKIIITRPNIGAGDSLGFFPGTLEEKMAPWIAPITSVLRERMGGGHYDEALGKSIKVVPLETIRGSSFENSFIILDEAQNTDIGQLKAFVTRQAEGSKCIINGDVRQTDLGEDSGLTFLIDIIKRRYMPVPIVEFSVDDIVRSGIVKEWVVAFLEEGL